MAGLKCEGGQLGLEGPPALTGSLLRAGSIPQHDRSVDEAMLVTGELCWVLHETCVMASGSVVKRCQVLFGVDVYLLVTRLVRYAVDMQARSH